MRYKILVILFALMLISLSFSVAHAKSFHKIDCSSIPDFGDKAPFTFLQKGNDIIDKNGNSIKSYKYDDSSSAPKWNNLIEMYFYYLGLLLGGHRSNLDSFINQLPSIQNAIERNGGYKLSCKGASDKEGNTVKGLQFPDTRGCAYVTVEQNGFFGKYTTDVAVITSPGVEDTIECFAADGSNPECPKLSDYMCKVASFKNTHDPVFIPSYSYNEFRGAYTLLNINGQKKTACGDGYVCNNIGRCVTKTDDNGCPTKCDKIDTGTISFVTD
ncbi:MAG: hypothetical protein HY831_05210 [Candidatus Aenigmarchaeota archaeon]|nr:hypothetical protein [Candidatus Aenigmarchaeota archaeon]